MTTFTTDAATFLDNLRAAQDQRMAHAQGLAEAAATRGRLAAELDAADRAYAAQFQSALEAGWTERELRAADLPAPAAKPAQRRGRGTRGSRGAAPVSPPAPAPADEQTHSPS
ncbi:hypothetical protein [Cellulomonas sp. Y8]|uniref:hypothetical protein n=1 Tax=Cellulomonas sp. Y8 TaxID=2591145 RepID=UPI003D72FD4B